MTDLTKLTDEQLSRRIEIVKAEPAARHAEARAREDAARQATTCDRTDPHTAHRAWRADAGICPGTTEKAER